MQPDNLPSDTARYSERLKNFLHKEGFRLTRQRLKILETFQDIAEGYHLTAEEIYQRLSEQGEKISFSTIYRALHIFVRLGIVRELELIDNRKYYELNSPKLSQHHHLICIQCGAVTEFEEDSILEISQREAQDRGFSMINCQFMVYGLCANCQSPSELGNFLLCEHPE